MSNAIPKPNTFTEAFLALQADIRPAIKDAKNPAFKSTYADLGAVWDAVREPLQNHGFAVIQTTDFDERDTWLATKLLHVSGESVVSRYPLRPTKSDPQGYGSALTYARRYSIMSMLGVITDDDDGTAASAKPAAPTQAVKPTQVHASEAINDKERAKKAADWAYEAKGFIATLDTPESLSAWHRKNANNIAAVKPLAPNAHQALIDAIAKREGDLNPLAA